ncbi:TetR/AcrR family transcriptional regulator [Paenibacillus macerans]|uniref:TetR/AcrR family transcriptional regulator n=1 Tax=Paenibacillus macerans TaxID=44252 RepID=UPI003D31DC7C
MNGFERRAVLKKQQIIRTSMEQLKTVPPAKLSVREVADKANVSVVTLYNYFQSKEGLIREVVRTILTEQLEQAERIMQSKELFGEKVRRLIFSKNAMIEQFHPELLQAIRQDEFLAEFSGKTNKLIEDFITEGKSTGELSEEIPGGFIRRLLELYRKDLSSADSLLLGGDSLDGQEWIINALLYGIARKA